MIDVDRAALLAMIDKAAGRRHSADGAVARTLDRILDAHAMVIAGGTEVQLRATLTDWTRQLERADLGRLVVSAAWAQGAVDALHDLAARLGIDLDQDA